MHLRIYLLVFILTAAGSAVTACASDLGLGTAMPTLSPAAHCERRDPVMKELSEHMTAKDENGHDIVIVGLKFSVCVSSSITFTAEDLRDLNTSLELGKEVLYRAYDANVEKRATASDPSEVPVFTTVDIKNTAAEAAQINFNGLFQHTGVYIQVYTDPPTMESAYEPTKGTK